MLTKAILSQKVKILLGMFFLACAGLSFIFNISKNKSTIDELIAPININIEVDKAYINSIIIVTEPLGQTWQFVPTSSIETKLKKEIIHTEIKNEYIQGISVRVPKELASTVISSIDSISIFIGNKLFYYNSFNISTWKFTTNNASTDFKIPVGVYKKSFIKSWINWYGDLNFILKETIALITKPHKFVLVYVFIFALFFLLRNELFVLLKKYNKKAEIIMFILLLLFGFLLRINAFTRYSAWVDELGSAAITSNPNVSIINCFKDPGNPPLYFIVLRVWFNIFGWSETSGRLLSVVLGSCGIVSLYLFIKSVCGKKYAFISAFLLTISYTSIGYSNEIRPYILLILLGPLVSYMFFTLLKNQNVKNYTLYTIFSILLINSHYYGALYIAGNFIFYFIYKRLTLERLVFYFTCNRYVSDRLKIIKFFLINIFIVLSFIPYFFITFLNDAFLNKNFNTWIPKPGRKEYILVILLIFTYLIIKIITIIVSKKYNFDKIKISLFHYSIFLVIFIYLSAFIISLYRSIFTWRYFSICLPLIIVILTFTIIIFSKIGLNLNTKFYLFNKPLIIISLILFFILSNFLSKWTLLGGGTSDTVKEGQQYISIDAKNHTLASQINAWWWYDDYCKLYGLVPLPPYNPFSLENNNNIAYINFPHTLTDEIVNHELLINGIDINEVLKIRLRNNRYILKILTPNYKYSSFAELKISKDIEFLKTNVYDINNIAIKDDDIILNCGNIDPQIYIVLQEPIYNPNLKTYIEISYTNTIEGYFQIFYDYGNGLSEPDSFRCLIKTDSEETTMKLPIIGWNEGQKLVAIRIDPPDNTEFVIKEIKILSLEKIQD